VALTPSPARSSFKDPRETGEAANQRLSSYFEGKAENKPAFSYSTGGGEAPASSGSAPAPAGPKAPTSTGGSGFVNFGQYFGANAPAVQAQAEKAAAGAKDFGALNVMQGPGGMGTGTQPPSAFDVMLGQGTTSREAAKEGQQRFKQLSERLGTPLQDPQQANVMRYNEYLRQGGSSGTYRDLSEDEKKWVRAAVDGTSFV